ncbi:NADH-quinone oxidoreductase subunit NuoF [Biformimicrobium ophioploci]|uniref:NADH-quinone oxidoreductase subunit F n=1 Tax=Biformimicrobium ophioploci TaxID=3036711 RepID=A0ABQ6LX51_9GAMM|nr:NADH-quinone oxidoreductase subunit NuoF [Microbulbifer sp. NKW57]GMG86684.1 NADH-quinone oxidoreductase subunit NuoF [Microbulbifer sp. NKW57]
MKASTPLTKNIGPENIAATIEQYQANGGYAGLKKALSTMQPNDVVETVQAANLRGRGGAGFNTGLKWSFVPRGEGSPATKYLVCNADEMEPGTFKDRLLMERDPHQLIEGMIISAYGIEAVRAYIFIRGEYHLAADRLEHAIEEAYEHGYLGHNICGTKFSLDLYVHRSAGNYICGEETALLNALEGKRANPRAKPPFPQVSGLWGKPTVVNNVETLCNISHIIANGPEWYRGLGKGADAGTKLFGVSGRVKNPGTWELPMGTSIREIIELHAGGMQDGYKLKAFLPGGGSTDFLGPEHLDLPMDYDAIGKAGSRMGTGTMIILDDKTCPIGMVRNLMRFFAKESCGFCTPCRDGLPWVEKILTDIEQGKGSVRELDQLAQQVWNMRPGNTFCALAPGAAEPLQSALKMFRKEFLDHIERGCCPYEAAETRFVGA